jgi:hypothetical protein
MTERVHNVGDPMRPARLVENPQSTDNPILTFFLSYWHQKRIGSSIPTHSSFNPKEIRGHLPWVVVVDALPDFEDFRYRVVGTNVCRYYLADGTGKLIREAFAGLEQGTEIAEGTLALYRHACVTREPFSYTGPSSVYRDIYYPDFDALYLPYSADGMAANRVVNVFTFNYQKFVKTRSQSALMGTI